MATKNKRVTITCERCHKRHRYTYRGSALKLCCPSCLIDKANEYERKRSAKRRDANACPRCGDTSPSSFTHIQLTGRRKTYCIGCNNFNTAQQQKFRDANPEDCYERSKESARRWREKNPNLVLLAAAISRAKKTKEERRKYRQENYIRMRDKKIADGTWEEYLADKAARVSKARKKYEDKRRKQRKAKNG